MVREACEAGADIIMLDNMSDDQIRQAVEIIGGRAKTECSGNVTGKHPSAGFSRGGLYLQRRADSFGGNSRSFHEKSAGSVDFFFGDAVYQRKGIRRGGLR